MSRRSEANYVPALTGVRAMAAYLVFISHFCDQFDENFPHLLQRFLGEFHIGVSLFFVLSGFLITFRYYDKFQGLNAEWFKQYLKNRVARIYPMYALLTIAAFVYYFFSKRFLAWSKLDIFNMGFFERIIHYALGPFKC